MFEDRIKEAVTLKVPAGTFSDGQVLYQEHTGYAFISDFTSRDTKTYGNIKKWQNFSVRCDVQLDPGSQVVHDGQIYDLKDIKVCRNIEGEVECYRCVVM